MRYVILAAMAIASLSNADTHGTGFVTPTSLTLTFTRVSLVKVDNSQVQILDGNFTHEFKKSDTDFAAVSLADITIPEGRYGGVSICYNTDRSVKLDGVKYTGADGTVVHNGDNVWTTTAANALTAGSVVTSAPAGGAVTLAGLVTGNGTNNCSSSQFAAPVCVASATDNCQAGDTKIDVNSTLPNLNLLLDMYNSVAIDAGNGSADNHTPIYPYPTLGAAGAAMHLSKGGTSGVANVSLLFDTNKKLLFASSYGNGTGSDGFCSGVGFVTATSVPAGSFSNSFGPTAVMKYTEPKVEFATGNCGNSNTCTSNGLFALDNVKQAVDSDVNMTCVADTTGGLGYGYTGGAGVPSTTGATIKVNRVMDPGNIFGVCATNSGVCGSYQ